MNTLVMKLNVNRQHSNQPVCNTSRGRALHTVDWFLNGKRQFNNYDTHGLSLHNDLAG